MTPAEKKAAKKYRCFNAARLPPRSCWSLRAVEDVIEAGVRCLARLVGGAAQRLGDETGVGIASLDVPDKPVPEIARNLVGGVAAETFELERQEMLHHAE